MSFFKKNIGTKSKMDPDTFEVQLVNSPSSEYTYQSFGLSPSEERPAVNVEDSWSFPYTSPFFSSSVQREKAKALLEKNAQCCDNCEECMCKCKCMCVVL